MNIETIEFQAVNDCSEINGYVFCEDFTEDEDPVLYFYDENGFECGNYITNRVSTDSSLIQAFSEDNQIQQILFDFQNEINKKIERRGFDLIINPQ